MTVLEPRYRPVLELESGRVVGAELVAPWPHPDQGSVPRVACTAAHAFAFGPAADEGWWVGIRLRPGQVAAPSSVDAVAVLLRASGLAPRRLVLRLTHTELDHAVSSGSARALGALGVQMSVTGFGTADWSPASLRAAPVSSVQVSLTGLDRSDPADVGLVRSVVDIAESCGVAVIGRDVESGDQLRLAADAGVTNVEGYWWGSPGSLSKLLGTWARLPFSG